MEMRSVGLTDEQRLLAETCRGFVDGVVLPWLRDHRDHEWLAPPEERTPVELLSSSDGSTAAPPALPS